MPHFAKKENEAGDGDVYFKLLKDGKALFDLPGMTEDNRRPSLKFVKVAAVSFKDYNGDGKKDIIIINEYSRQGKARSQAIMKCGFIHRPEERKNFL